MNKLIIVLLLAGGLWGLWPFFGDSKTYWQNVGPNWDRLLNPCSYEECEQ